MDEEELNQFNAISTATPSSLEELSEGLNGMDLSDQTGFFPPPPGAISSPEELKEEEAGDDQGLSESEPLLKSASIEDDEDQQQAGKDVNDGERGLEELEHAGLLLGF